MDIISYVLSKKYSDRDNVVIATDYPSIQDAIDSLPEFGGEVYIPPGIYNESLIIDKPNVKMHGTWESIIKTPDNAVKGENDSTLRVLKPGCLIENLKFCGNPQGNPDLNSQPEAVTSDGVGIYANDCTVRNCWFVDTMGHSIIVWNDSFGNTPRDKRHDIIIEGNLIEGDGFRAKIDVARDQPNVDGEYVYTNNHVIISGNRIRNTNQYGIIIHWGTEISIVNNHIENTGNTGIRPHGHIENISVKGNILKDIGGVGVHLHNSGFPYNNAIVEGNIITNTSSFGIQAVADSSENFIIKNNIIKNPGATRAIEAGCKGLIIDGNIVKGGAIQATNSAINTLIVNNYVNDSSIGGISIRADYITVRGNTIYNSPYGIRLPLGDFGSGSRIEYNEIIDCNRGIQLDTEKKDTVIAFNRFLGEYDYSLHRVSNLIGNSSVKENIGFKTENKGLALIQKGETSIKVSHGIGKGGFGSFTSPDYKISKDMVKISPSNSLGNSNKFWISDISSTDFTISVDVDPGEEGAEFVWEVKTF